MLTELEQKILELEQRVLELEHEQADMCLVSYFQGVEDGKKAQEAEVGRIRKIYDSQMDILRKRVESLLLDKEFLTSNVNHAESLAAALLAEKDEMPFESDYLCATCQHTDRSCPDRGNILLQCNNYKPDLPNVSRLTGELKEREAEIERLKKEVSHTKEVEFPRRIEKVTATIRAKLQAAEALAASRLADQEAIERHVSKRVAREILLIMEGSESYEDAVSEIRNQYGVE